MALSTSGGGVRAQATQRTDWDALIEELYVNTVSGASFGIGVAGKQKGFLGASMKMRLNQRFGNPQITQYVRKAFQVAKLDALFQSAEGLESAGSGIYKVTGEKMGLPRNTLLYAFENPRDSNLRGVILFGGERLEGHLEKRVAAANDVLEGSGRSSARGGLALESPQQLKEALGKINVKRLYEYDMDLLARIVNGLEESKEELPKHLKPIFKSVADYILKRRLKQGR